MKMMNGVIFLATSQPKYRQKNKTNKITCKRRNLHVPLLFSLRSASLSTSLVLNSVHVIKAMNGFQPRLSLNIVN